MRYKSLLLAACFFISVNTFSQDLLLPFKDANGKYGYKSEEGAVVISPRYVSAHYPSDDFYRVTEVGEVVDRSAFGIKLIVTENAKWGYLDEKGKVAIPLLYSKAFDFKNGLACVSLDGETYGLIDKRGRNITAFKYTVPITDEGNEVTWNFKSGLALIGIGKDKNRLFGFIDKQGNEIVPPKYKLALNFEDGMAAVLLSDKWGFIDATGKVVINYQFEDNFTSMLYSFADGQAHVKKDGKYIYINKSGKEVEATFKSRVYNVLKAGAENYYNNYGILLNEDAGLKTKFYKPNITLNGNVESIAVSENKKFYTTKYDPIQNPNIAEYKATILQVFSELSSGLGDRSAKMYTDNYVLREITEKDGKVYVLNEKTTGAVVAILADKGTWIEFNVPGR